MVTLASLTQDFGWFLGGFKSIWVDRQRINLGWVLGGSRSTLAMLGCGFSVTMVGRGGRGAMVGLGRYGLWDVWVWVLVSH